MDNAIISIDSKHRFLLSRDLCPDRHPTLPVQHCLFIMLNPSTADAIQDDPTIRRCKSFASREGCHVLEVVNLFSKRSPHPSDLVGGVEDCPAENIEYVEHAIKRAHVIIAAWGSHPIAKKSLVRQYLGNFTERFYCLGVTKDGSPKHPLYIKKDQPLLCFYDSMKQLEEKES